ncbi:hypothetical protein Patl1_23201 [Pistacia atlantica]|uniref:Uncharacterized protein n=1 Tax=Pistacia atlantica TaxID=434234 RepID=A0ACC1A110_9ROSI|nr:hypothetical protein Patl1_23201 [Pistacia atlantica]
MGDNLFEGLPPPSSQQQNRDHEPEQEQQSTTNKKKRESSPVPAPAPILKSALKKPKSNPEATMPQKSLRFKTTTDASQKQIIDAMQKIALHIKNPTKFGKASKLAIQMIQAASVKPGTSDHFFAILEAAMSLPTSCTDASVRADYHALFSAAQDAAEFSKTSTQIKEIISNLPVATEDDNVEEAAALKDDTEITNEDDQSKQDVLSASLAEGNNKNESDPFGLDALIPNKTKKDDRTKVKKETADCIRKEEEEENKRFLKEQREALVTCLEIAAHRYKTPWEQQTRRRQGKSVTGKLDVNGFEWLQQKYASEKISIRHSVGGGGDRRAQQWLG